MKYYLPPVCGKYLLTKNIGYYKITFSLAAPIFSLKLFFVSAKDPVNLNIFTVALLIVCQMTQCMVLTVKCFYLRRNKGPSVLWQAKFKRVAMISNKSQRLNIGSKHHKDATQVASGIIEKFKKNVIFFLIKLMKL